MKNHSPQAPSQPKHPMRRLIFISILTISLVFNVLFVGFLIYPNVSAGRSPSYEVQVLSSAQAGIIALYPSKDYTTLNVQQAYEVEIFPSNMNSFPTKIINQYGGEVSLGPSMSDGSVYDINSTEPARYFYITYPNVPTDKCLRIADATIQNFDTVIVNTTTVQKRHKDPALNINIDESKITQACKNSLKEGAKIKLVSS